MLLLPKIYSLKDTPEETIHIAKLVLYSQWFFFYRNRKRHSSYSSTCGPDSLRSRVVLTLLAQKNWDVHVFLQRSDIGREVNDI